MAVKPVTFSSKVGRPTFNGSRVLQKITPGVVSYQYNNLYMQFTNASLKDNQAVFTCAVHPVEFLFLMTVDPAAREYKALRAAVERHLKLPVRYLHVKINPAWLHDVLLHGVCDSNLSLPSIRMPDITCVFTLPCTPPDNASEGKQVEQSKQQVVTYESGTLSSLYVTESITRSVQ